MVKSWKIILKRSQGRSPPLEHPLASKILSLINTEVFEANGHSQAGKRTRDLSLIIFSDFTAKLQQKFYKTGPRFLYP
jgi:hypothetical protein